jgi:hypothetical protein
LFTCADRADKHVDVDLSRRRCSSDPRWGGLCGAAVILPNQVRRSPRCFADPNLGGQTPALRACRISDHVWRSELRLACPCASTAMAATLMLLAFLFTCRPQDRFRDAQHL